MKHNLAKVLGLEEYNEEPNIRVEPTEDEVIQIEQDKFVQEMADHSEATTEALEAIGNAQALACVIARNDSQDKTAYELLKVAVEQLKEKTGVYTQSVSLESLDKGSYKTEALEDVKKFISKVWEAIKKAFFSMVDKVKVFVKMLFDRTRKSKQSLEEAKKETAEFVKEVKNVPKSEKDGKTHNKEYFKRETKAAPPPFTASSRISQYIGTKNNRDFTLTNVLHGIEHLYKELDDFTDELIAVKPSSLAQEFAKGNGSYVAGDSDFKPSYTGRFNSAKLTKILGGTLGPEVRITLNDIEDSSVVVNYQEPVRYVRAMDPSELEGYIFDYLIKINKLAEKLTSGTQGLEKEMNSFFKSQEEIYNSMKSDDETTNEKIESIKQNNKWFQKMVSNLISVRAKLVTYMNNFVDGFSMYSKANIAYYTAHIAADLNDKYYVSPMDYEEYSKHRD